MEQINLNIKVKEAFGNLYRKKCVLVAVIDNDGKILTGAKPYFFPPKITRLLGGGVDEGENIDIAAVRELSEELGIALETSGLIPLAQFNTHAKDATGKEFYNETFLYAARIGNTPYKAGDDVKQIIGLSIDELRAIGQAYADLPEALWYRGKEGDFSWKDYGKLYSVIHNVTADKIANLK